MATVQGQAQVADSQVLGNRPDVPGAVAVGAAEDVIAADEVDAVSEDREPEDRRSLRARVLELSERIHSLVAGHPRRIQEIDVAQEVAASVKPYVDRLVALKRLLSPVDRIAAHQGQIEALQASIAADMAEVEGLSDGMAGVAQDAVLVGLEGEIAAVKRDRKLHVSQVDAEEAERQPQPQGSPAAPPRPLLELSPAERFARILGGRFVSVARLAQVLQVDVEAGEAQVYEGALEQVWASLLGTEELRPHAEQNRARTLHSTFGDYALLLRYPRLAGGRPCTLEQLRGQFGAHFLHLSEQALWYSGMEFANATFDRPHWALIDRQYLNCTFKKPSIRLLMYARANDLSPRIVRQKSALEDVYDRIVMAAVCKEPFFASCNSVTRTTYEPPGGGEMRQVYVYAKDACIRISGRRGTPHWRPTRPRWPGVLPAVVFPV